MWAALQGLVGQILSEDTLARRLHIMPLGGAFHSGKGSRIALGRKSYDFVKMQGIWLKSGCCGCKLESPLDRACLNLRLILFNV